MTTQQDQQIGISRNGAESPGSGSAAEVLAVFTRLGLTSFGGPVAHLGYFLDELIRRRNWLTEEEYADLVALCQFLPGPASSQVAFALGVRRAGLMGGLAAWLGFTMPSALLLLAFGLGVTAFGDVSEAGWLRGLKIVAVAPTWPSPCLLSWYCLYGAGLPGWWSWQLPLWRACSASESG